MRRSRLIENPVPGGPCVEQIQNAYALLVPQEMRHWLATLLHRPPNPTCDEDRRKREQDAYNAMLASMPLAERHDATWTGDRLLGEMLRRIAVGLDERETYKGESGTQEETGRSY